MEGSERKENRCSGGKSRGPPASCRALWGSMALVSLNCVPTKKTI
jgi:hypothetical protein